MAEKKQFIDYYLKYGKTDDVSWNQLAEIYHFPSGEALRSFVRRWGHTFKLSDPIQDAVRKSVPLSVYDKPVLTEQDSNRQTGDETLTFQSSKPLSPEEIDALAQVDNITRVVTRTWLKSSRNGIWTYSICTKLIDPTEESKTDYRKEFEDFLAEKIKDKGIDKLPDPISLTDSENALILSLSDLHLDKKSYWEETGEAGYSQLAATRAIMAAQDIIQRARAGHKLTKIVIIGGNDFFHANSAANTTKKGTPLDVDGRWNQSFKDGLHLMTKIIDIANSVAPVQYITVLGNHSPEREFYLSVALEAYYRNIKTVSVETVNNVRKYFRFGNNAFLLSHEFGNKEKDLPVIFAVENAKDFAECRYKFILSGHIHSKKETMFVGANEQYGILHKVMPSLSSTDLWHHENLFIGNQKSCIGLVINAEYGEIAELIYNF